MFLAITANVLAFSLGTIFLERYNLSVGVAVFVITALTGAILSTLIEAYMKSMLTSGQLARVRRPVSREGPKPLPSSTGSS